MSKKYRSIVPNNWAGKSILDYLSGRFTYRSIESWENEIHSQRILIQELPTHKDFLLKGGESITYLPIPIPEPEVRRDLKILYEDEWYVAMDKPPFLPVHPSGPFQANTALKISESIMNTKLYLCHRIDRETSGVLLFAKNTKSLSKLQNLFSNEGIYKKYHVAVFGNFPDELNLRGSLEMQLGSKIRKKYYFSENEEGKVETHFRKVFHKSELSFLEALPKSGKTHQIRATLCSIGFPVVGDKMYGKSDDFYLEFLETGNTKELAEKAGFHRQILHASELGFRHPETNGDIMIKSSIPKDIKDFLDMN